MSSSNVLPWAWATSSRWVLAASLGLGCLGLGLGMGPGEAAAQAQVAASPTFKIESGQLVLPSPVVFEEGSDKLKPQSEAALGHVKAFLDEKTYITLLRVESHTDANGAPAATQALTEKRAVAVARWLISHGVDCKRLLAVGFGATKPLMDNATAQGRAQNRRTAFVMAALRERPIGGMPVDGGGRVASAALCAPTP